MVVVVSGGACCSAVCLALGPAGGSRRPSSSQFEPALVVLGFLVLFFAFEYRPEELAVAARLGRRQVSPVLGRHGCVRERVFGCVDAVCGELD